MIKTIRLESFQFSAFLQIVILVVGFIGIGFMERPPKEAGLLLFFIGVILMFWIIYIIRFNYIVHFSAYRHEK
jgi:membrane-bound ClpP family serine protease